MANAVIEQLELFERQAQIQPSSTGYFSLNFFNAEHSRLQQQMYPAARMPWVLDEAARMEGRYGRDFYISQAIFSQKKRRIATFKDCSMLWVDLDFYRAPHVEYMTHESFSALVAGQIEDMGLPPFSFTISSGRGLYVKWILDKPVPAAAMPRWHACLRYLQQKFAHLGADEKATSPTQILRVTGSINTKQPQWYPLDERQVRVIDANTVADGSQVRTYDFEYMAEHILPYSRDEVRAWRQAWRDEHPGHEKWPQYAKNEKQRRAWLAGQKHLEVRPEIRHLVAVDEGALLSWKRLTALRAIAAERGGIHDGQGRNEWAWISANLLAQVSRGSEHRYDLSVVYQEIVPSYTPADALASASAVSRRLHEGRDLYRMKTTGMLKRLGISPDEWSKHYKTTGGAGKTTKNVGAMGLAPIRDLSFGDYRKETLRRQQEAGRFAARVRAGANEEKRATAILMRQQGLSVRAISDQLGVPKSTVSDWVSGTVLCMA